MTRHTGPYPIKWIVVPPRDEVKQAHEVTCDAMSLRGRESEGNTSEVVAIMWSAGEPIDRVGTVTLTPYDPRTIMGRSLISVRPSGKHQRVQYQRCGRVSS